MKQLVQKLGNGDISILDIPTPQVRPGNLLIQSSISLISSGTERMLIDFGKSNFVEKIKKQPDKAEQVLDKIKTDGLLPTIKAVNNKLDSSIPLGYSNVGKVVAIGSGVNGFNIGDRVVSNGSHAEIVSIPQNLCAKVPDALSDDDAAFAVLSSIGLQAVRLAKPEFSETFLVIGLGLIGLLTAQILKANGCRVLAYDIDASKCKIARQLGITTLNFTKAKVAIDWCISENHGKGIDGVIITASTDSTSPVEIAANVSRKRGRIILVGVTGLDIKRDWFYKKELTFQVSCSYGSERYDEDYQTSNTEYPIGIFRWTTKRNFESVLEAILDGQIKTELLKSNEYFFEDAVEAFENLHKNKSNIGILLKYKNTVDVNEKKIKLHKILDYSKQNSSYENPVIGFIGAGNYAKSFLIPAFAKTKVKLSTLVSQTGINASLLGKKYSFDYLSSDVQDLFNNDTCNTIAIATRHDSHAEFVLESIKKRKNVFVEKPLCMNLEELDKIESSYLNVVNKNKYGEKNPLLMIGFNRRFAPLTLKLKSILKNRPSVKSIIYTCNAGIIPDDHWLYSPKYGGGRIIGEAIHFIDLVRFLIDSPIIEIKVNFAKNTISKQDSFVINISFADGSIGVVNYFSNGSRKFPKERIEVFSSGKVYQIDNFKKLKAWGEKNFFGEKVLIQNKGQNHCIKSFINSITDGSSSPIPINEIFEVHRKLFEALI